MHLTDMSVNFIGENPVVGASIPIGTGVALASKQLGLKRVALVFFGEDAINNGVFHEGLNLASLWKLPVIFLCENNQYGMGVAIDKASTVTDVHHKARMANIESVQIDGMNALAVHEAVKKAVEHCSSGQGPYFIEAMCYRYQGHSVADPDKYRDQERLDEWKKRDAIAVVFFKDVNDQQELIDPADTFPDNTETVYLGFDYIDLPAGGELEALVYYADRESETLTMLDKLDKLAPSGTGYVPITSPFINSGGLESGTYHVDVHINGELLANGEFTVQ